MAAARSMCMRYALLLFILATTVRAADVTIDLTTPEGVAAVRGVWRYSDARLIEVASPSGVGTAYDYTPHAGGAEFDDSTWQILDPSSLGHPRSTGKICFNWYRINVTVPESMAGMTIVFETVVDDYGEVWIDGRLPRDLGQSGGSVVRGFNAPNRLVIAQNAQPGQRIQIAVFGINGPISDAPDNFIFLRSAKLEGFFTLAPRRRGI
jgi:gluconolactonase